MHGKGVWAGQRAEHLAIQERCLKKHQIVARMGAIFKEPLGGRRGSDCCLKSI
jgi:hypothetical protein